MVRVLYIKAHKEDKHYSNEKETTHDSDESDYSDEYVTNVGYENIE